MTFLHVHNGGRLLKRVETAFISTLEAQNHQFEIKNCDDSYSSTYEEFKEYFKFNKSGYFIAYRDSIAAAITSQVGKNKLPTHIEISSQNSGLKADSVILTEQIRTIDKSRLKEKIGHIDDNNVMNQINNALGVSFGL